MVHGSWTVVSMGNDMLAFGAMLRVTVGVEVFLLYVEPSNCGRYLCCLGRFCRLVMDDHRFKWFMGFPRRGQHFSDSVNSQIHGFWYCGDGSRMSYGLKVVVIYNVLSRAAFDAQV